MSVAQGIIETSTKGKLMEYGKLVALTQVAFGYSTPEDAGVALGKLLYSGSSDAVINHLVSLLNEAIAKQVSN
jgi:hypothetical protein